MKNLVDKLWEIHKMNNENKKLKKVLTEIRQITEQYIGYYQKNSLLNGYIEIRTIIKSEDI